MVPYRSPITISQLSPWSWDRNTPPYPPAKMLSPLTANPSTPPARVLGFAQVWPASSLRTTSPPAPASSRFPVMTRAFTNASAGPIAAHEAPSSWERNTPWPDVPANRSEPDTVKLTVHTSGPPEIVVQLLPLSTDRNTPQPDAVKRAEPFETIGA